MSVATPKEWAVCKLEEVVSAKKGNKPSVLRETPASEFVPYLDICAIETGKIRRYAHVASSRITDGSELFMVWDGARSGWTGLGQAGAIGSTIMALKPIEIDSAYLKAFLDTQFESINTNTRGTGIPHVDPSYLWEIDIPLAALAEQKEIAKRLDTLLAQVDTLKTRLDAIPKIIKRFRQSVLASAVSGKLTEEWRGSAGLALDSWSQTNIGAVSTVATGKTPKRSEGAYWSNGTIPWLTSTVTGQEFCFAAEQFVTEYAVKDCSLKIFEEGTLLLAMYGEGKTRGQVTELKLAATCNQACATIIVDAKIALKKYVKLRLKENYEETRKAAAGGAQPNLNLNKVREIPILLPSLEEQTEIIRRVEELFAFADQVEQRVKDAQARINNMTQSILAKAFRGELTADWRAENSDLITGENSAEALLARIKSERGNLTVSKQKKRELSSAQNKKRAQSDSDGPTRVRMNSSLKTKNPSFKKILLRDTGSAKRPVAYPIGKLFAVVRKRFKKASFSVDECAQAGKLDLDLARIALVALVQAGKVDQVFDTDTGKVRFVIAHETTENKN